MHTAPQPDDTAPAHVLARGGSLYEWLRRPSLDPDDRHTRTWLIVATVALAWVPLVILAASTKWTSGAVDPLIVRAEPHARLLGALVLLSLAELLLGKQAAMVADSVVTDDVLQPSSIGDWQRDILAIRRWRDAWALDLCWLAVGLGALGLAYFDRLPDWAARWMLSTLHGVEWSAATAAWWWYVLIAQPLLLVVMLRWLWRWLLWGVLLWRLARLDLDVRAIHGDRAGGLGFATITRDSLQLFILGSGLAIASVWYDEIVVGRAQLSTFAGDLIVFVTICLALLILPYLGFTPKLVRARERAVIDYAALMREYASRFEQRWLSRRERQRRDMLDSADFSSLVDLRGTTAELEQMRSLVPSGKDLQAVLIAAALPFAAVVIAHAPSAAVLLRNAIMRFFGG